MPASTKIFTPRVIVLYCINCSTKNRRSTETWSKLRGTYMHSEAMCRVILHWIDFWLRFLSLLQFFSKWGWSPARLQSTDSCWSKDCKEFNSADDLFLPGHSNAPTIMQFFIPMTCVCLEQQNIFTRTLLRLFLTLDSQRIGGWRWWWGQWWCGAAKWL